ncbi:hypothetical protein AMTRI_Chr13g116300 [Amborella trichopoda]
MKPTCPTLLPLSLLLFSLLPALSLSWRPTVPLQLLSLLAIKYSIYDPSLSLNDWQYRHGYPIPPFCTWSSVSCKPNTTHIISLDLSHKNLSGFLSPQIRFLTQLQYLNLSNNGFQGPFPTSIFSLLNLTAIDISHNSFNSTFPLGIRALEKLTHFNAFSNNFTGTLPYDLPHLLSLEFLNFGGSFFEGSIPASFGGFPAIKHLNLAGNLLTDEIPLELGNLTLLERLEIGYNNFIGGIPAKFGKLQELKYLDMASCNLSGVLPPEIGNLGDMESLFLFKNHFIGEIPASFSNLTSLLSLDLSDNQLSGEIPVGFSELKNLTMLSLLKNKLSGQIPQGIEELPNLETLLLWNNSFNGSLPSRLGLNSNLQVLDVSSNMLSGPLPESLCHGNKLWKLILFSNAFSSEIPKSLTECVSLWRFRVAGNRFSGEIPAGFGSMRNLTYMDLSCNNLSGKIPDDLSSAQRLQFLNISGNQFNGNLPESLWGGPNLQIFSASFSGLKGKIPSFSHGCKSLYKLELNGNAFSGLIPSDINHCQKLLNLRLNRNQLSGSIPREIAEIPVISEIDLSENSLTGLIPDSFDNVRTLESFNVSFNQLSGPVPCSGSIFRSLHPASFLGNENLCGLIVNRPCLNTGNLNSNLPENVISREPKRAGVLVWIMGAVFLAGIFVLIVGSRCFIKNYQILISGSRSYREELIEGPWKMTAFQRLNFTVETVIDCLKNSDNIIGMGSAGTVYKAQLPGGETIAVKKLWGNQKETIKRRRGGSLRGALIEVELLGHVRHRNIVRLLGFCSNNDITLLLYEYMPNGSLDELLHGNKEANLLADWFTRYNIAVGVAQGICYLHHDCHPVIVHRDLKPGNILLDAEMEARVADFGVAKLIQGDESMSAIAGSYGYIAPEYAYTLQVDEKSDIYSFGVVLMEILSGRRSVESEFGDGNSIVDWVRSKIKTKEGVSEVLDKNVGASCGPVREEMMLVLRVALLCTARCPNNRPSMRDVVSMLQEAKPKRKLQSGGNGNGGGGNGSPLPKSAD